MCSEVYIFKIFLIINRKNKEERVLVNNLFLSAFLLSYGLTVRLTLQPRELSPV